MRIALLTAVGLLAGLFVSATPGPAHADQYKWCAMYNGGETGASANCYFVTLEQCQWAVSGVGGFCTPSPFDGNRPASSWGQQQPQQQQQLQQKRKTS